MSEKAPSVDQWLREAKADPAAARCGMFLVHNGTVRQTSRGEVRHGRRDEGPVSGMRFDYDGILVERAVEEARQMPGIHYVRVWLNRGELTVGDDIMLVLIGGDIRPRVVDALQTLVGTLKDRCVTERELFSREEQT